MIQLTRASLENLRDQLRARGQRPSIVLPSTRTSAELIEAMQIVEEWGPVCEAMYLVMAADKRVVNAEREVLRGALAVLSNDRVRTTHMEAMLDASARKVAEEGTDKRLAYVIDALREDPARAELTAVLAFAVAAADNVIVPEEQQLLNQLFKGLGIHEERANELMRGLATEIAK
jgi:tellurite resistance protein